MAILIEEKKSTSSLFRLIGWLVVVIILIVAAYYIFFVAPPALVIVPSSSLQGISPISQATLQPTDVLNSPSFQALKPPSFALPTAQGPAAVGRVNPFVAP